MPAAATFHPELCVLDDPLETRKFTRIDGQGEAAIAESSLRLSGLRCAACADLIEQALLALDGVVAARVNSAAQRATVRWRPAQVSASVLVSAVRAAGYGAEPDTAAGARRLRLHEGRAALWRLFVAGFCAMQIMMLATPAYVAGPGELTDDLRQLLNIASWMLVLPVMLFSAAPFFSGAWQMVKRRRIGMDVPVAIGLAVSFCASSVVAFDPAGAGGLLGREVYFDSLAMFVSFLLLGRWLETRARHRSAQSLESSLDRLGRVALRVSADGSVEPVSPQRLQPGDRVRVPVGDAFPADGQVVTGDTWVDESLLTGESALVQRPCQASVVAGSVNRGAPVEVRVERVGLDTRHEAVVALMREALTQRSGLVRVADRMAAPFLWAVLGLAALAALGWSVIDPSRAVWVAVSVLIVTCPCALSLAAPSALLAATGALARRGLLLRHLDALEALARVNHVMLDKTGTLTTGEPAWVSIRRLQGCEGLDDATVLQAAASLAAWSTHPLAAALCTAAAALPRSTARPHAWRQVTESPGLGLAARDAQGCEWRLGSSRWLGASRESEAAGLTSVWFGRVGEGAGSPLVELCFAERLRPEAAHAVAAWQREGVRITLLSGDHTDRVEAVARQLGVATVLAHGATTPEGKLAALRAAQQRGDVVLMVGDGVNDAPVLARADVSVAMGHGALVARMHADAVLVTQDLSQLVQARHLARHTLRVVRQNLAWAAGYNAICVPVALAGYLPPWAAGLGMAISSLLVVGNSLRLGR